MLTAFTALGIFGGCTTARWYLNRSSRRKRELLGGRIQTTAVWNAGAAFSLPVPAEALPLASSALLALLWRRRRQSPVGIGLILGGGMSNLWERLRCGRVYDYIQFPKAPGPLHRYVFNLADISIFLGGLTLAAKSACPRMPGHSGASRAADRGGI